jgi:hypothetical protein
MFTRPHPLYAPWVTEFIEDQPTGYDEAETLSRLAGHNLAGFLQKPYTIETLLREIQSALSRKMPRNSG